MLCYLCDDNNVPPGYGPVLGEAVELQRERMRHQLTAGTDLLPPHNVVPHTAEVGLLPLGMGQQAAEHPAALHQHPTLLQCIQVHSHLATPTP